MQIMIVVARATHLARFAKPSPSCLSILKTVSGDHWPFEFLTYRIRPIMVPRSAESSPKSKKNFLRHRLAILGSGSILEAIALSLATNSPKACIVVCDAKTIPGLKRFFTSKKLGTNAINFWPYGTKGKAHNPYKTDC